MVDLTSSPLFGRQWCITGRLPSRRSMLLPRVRGGGTCLLLPWNVVMVGSYQSFPTLKIFRFWFRTPRQENHTDFPESLKQFLAANEGSLPGQGLHLPLWTTEADFLWCWVCPFPVWPFGGCAGGEGAETSGLQASCSHHFSWVWLQVPTISVTLKPARWLVWPHEQNRKWRLEKGTKRFGRSLDKNGPVKEDGKEAGK